MMTMTRLDPDNTILKSFIFAAVALLLSWGLVSVIAGPVAVTFIEILAVFTSYACTFLFVMQKRAAYLVGVVTTALYSILFFSSGLPGLAMFNLYMIGSLAYGYWRWGPDDNALVVDNTFGKFDFINYSAVAVSIATLLFLVALVFGWQVTALDFILTVMSGVAQIALDNKRKWNWSIWIVVNIISLYVFFTMGLYFVFAQYIYMLFNAFYALKVWKHGTNN